MAQAPAKSRIVVIERIADEALRLLEDRDDVEYELVTDTSEANLAQKVRDADAITVRTARLTPKVIEAANRAKVISRHGVGYDNIAVDACTAMGIPVAVAAGANIRAVAEHTLFLILAAAKRGIEFDAAIRSGRYSAARSGALGSELEGKTLLLIGFGRIGKAVAELARAFDLRIVVHDPFAIPAETPGVEFVAGIDAGLERADIVSLHVPLGDDTRNIVDAAFLAKMRKGSILINASRGGLVDETALAEAVKRGHIAAAGLDTFAEEPLPQSSPLIGEMRIVLSPHVAGLASETLVRLGMMTVRTALDAIDGHINPVLIINPVKI